MLCLCICKFEFEFGNKFIHSFIHSFIHLIEAAAARRGHQGTARTSQSRAWARGATRSSRVGRARESLVLRKCKCKAL